ncbi:hypothetical protein SAMN00808754_3031 [Thermanaeromonas toyohensis ToBE]|uniref:DUF7916 domain-containing protein n=2 Tax=Thermanaeromonas TaxID=202949 RepID=A0A1W1W233_9FIRM|nr:hypothetical protein SAMN00808754_3031 [Thermanaeromonas toyohensis ToBE]
MRILEAKASDFKGMKSSELKDAIFLSEGRTIMAEVVCQCPPLVDGVTNAELAGAFGADMVLLNGYDVVSPCIFGMPSEISSEMSLGFTRVSPGYGRIIKDIKELIGRPVGINLEPSNPPYISQGRMATPANAELALSQGADFIVITGNPSTGVTNEDVVKAVRNIKNKLKDRLIIMAGRMHGAGVREESGETLVNIEVIKALIEAGADGVLIPAPGTIPGVTIEIAHKWIQFIHSNKCLAITTIGTSQEGADHDTLRSLALNSKMVGADIHHIGDAGFSGIAFPENIMTYSIAIKGRRHTYRRMALSPLR